MASSEQQRACSAARERVLHVAESLFHERGYAAVTMHDIATALGIRQASLYYHAPGGKEELFVMVLERSLQRHREGLERAIAVADGGIETRLRAIAHWLIEQPPVNLFRIVKSDMGSIDCEQAERLSNMAFQAVFEPVVAVFRGAQQQHEIRDHPVDVLAGSFLAVMDGIWFAHHHFGSAYPMEQMADMMIDTLLNGLRLRD